jgi:excisionase family DNA binding protein
MSGNWALTIPEEAIEALARRVAELVGQQTGSADDTRGGWLDVKSAAAYLGTTQDAIRSAVRRQQLPGKRGNGRVLFTREELDRYVREGRA